jgi:hypothetical protein
MNTIIVVVIFSPIIFCIVIHVGVDGSVGTTISSSTITISSRSISTNATTIIPNTMISSIIAIISSSKRRIRRFRFPQRH